MSQDTDIADLDAPNPLGHAERGSNQSGMRAYNERLVLSLVRQHGALSKAEISRMTGLSAQTVSVIMRALEAEGLLQKGDPVRGKIGQPSVPMGIAPQGAFFLGLKVGRRSAEMTLIDFAGTEQRSARAVYDHPTPKAVMEFAAQALQDMLGALPPDQQDRVAGLGVALPFRMWDWDMPSDMASAGLAAWRGFDIHTALQEICPCPVYLCNDATAACGAELVFGAPDKPRDFLYIFVGYFVGGGLVLDNRLFTGLNGNAGALGSMPVPGAEGVQQLVEVASLSRLETMIEAGGHDWAQSWHHPDAWDVPQDILTAWMDGSAQALARAILSAGCVIDFQTVMIDGSLSAPIRAELVERTAQCLRGSALPGIDGPALREGTIGPAARSLGAASLPLSDRFLVDRNAFLKG